MSNTIPASPEVLRALVRGLSGLYNGDLNDRAQADAVTSQVFEATGLVVTRSGVWQDSDANDVPEA